MDAKYDAIGIDYSNLRRSDRRIEQSIWRALGEARTVVNVGAGAGSYEPIGRAVTAVEPSARMIAQRARGAPPCVQACAEAMPFADGSFDAAMCVLTVHHWSDRERGLAELRRVARGRIVILTFDPSHRGMWLQRYFPGLAALDDGQMPSLSDYGRALGPTTIEPVPVPRDCTDGFLYAYWCRPRAYLDPQVRAAVSAFHALGDVSAGVERLRADIDSGAWQERHAELLERECLDVGYRLVVAE